MADWINRHDRYNRKTLGVGRRIDWVRANSFAEIQSEATYPWSPRKFCQPADRSCVAQVLTESSFAHSVLLLVQFAEELATTDEHAIFTGRTPFKSNEILVLTSIAGHLDGNIAQLKRTTM